jgi:succinylglutamate desuccinylase
MLRIVQAIATVKIAEGIEFEFANSPADLKDISRDVTLIFPPDLDRYNFATIPQGTVIATLLKNLAWSPLRAWDETDQDVTEQFFQTRSSQIIAKTNLYPAMLTLDGQIIRQDCFCYLVQDIELPIEK